MNYTKFKKNYVETDLKSLIAKYNITMTQLSDLIGIPFRTIQNWCNGSRKPNDYMIEMINYILENEKVQEEKEMKKTRFEVESDVNNLVDDIAEEYAIEKDFYGDCYPQDVMSLENQMELCHNEEEYDELLDEVEKILKGYVPGECKFEGKKWGDISQSEKEELLENANVSNSLGVGKDGSCTVDFEVLSVAAKVDLTSDEVNNFTIDDNAVLYNARR